MRLWSLHPVYLDSKGLTALWREGLLAQKVLLGETKGYRNHPQLLRFKESSDSLAAIGTYLHYVWQEGEKRNYNFSREKILFYTDDIKLEVNRGQVLYEFNLLLAKLNRRNEAKYREICSLRDVVAHPLFIIKEGDVESWERVH